MQITFVFFILFTIILILGSLYFKFNSKEPIAGIVLAVGFLGISIGFGLRWFTASGDYAASTPNTAWPPSINVCPDYLSLATIDKTKVCVDTIGVSNPPNSANILKKWTGGANTGTDYYFNLNLNLNGNARIKALTDQCKLKGLTWQGVWDGMASLNKEPPRP
jgi:hypothetical protein